MQVSSSAQRKEGVDHAARSCPIGRAGDRRGDRWTLLILRDATAGITRFDAFRENLGIADNILSARLARLVGGGGRNQAPPPGGARAAWRTRHTSPSTAVAPMQMLHVACGGQVSIGGVCGTCGQAVPREDEA